MSQKTGKKLDFPPPVVPTQLSAERVMPRDTGSGRLSWLSLLLQMWSSLENPPRFYTSRNKALLAKRPFISPNQIGISYHLLHVYYIRCWRQTEKKIKLSCSMKQFCRLFKTMQKLFIWKITIKITITFRASPRSLCPNSSGSEELLVQQCTGPYCSEGLWAKLALPLVCFCSQFPNKQPKTPHGAGLSPNLGFHRNYFPVLYIFMIKEM